MGAPTPSMPQNPTNQPLQQPQSGGKGAGKGGNSPNPNQMTPDGGNMTLSSTSGQPQTGQPNAYANTTGSWDNSSIQRPPTMPQMGGGKGKGA